MTENQAKNKRKPIPWSKFGKIKVGTEKKTSGSYVFGTTKKRRGNAIASRKTTPCVIRVLCRAEARREVAEQKKIGQLEKKTRTKTQG